MASSGSAWLGECDSYISVSEDSPLPITQGLHRYEPGHQMVKASDRYIRRNEVIAINQEVYDRSDFGVALIPAAPDVERAYLSMGFQLHQLQDNAHGFGLMSSGYSSFSGHPLASSIALDQALEAGEQPLPSYFALAGRVSPEQIDHRGRDEDSVHMTGPAEKITRDMADFVPEYMVPDRTVVLSGFPTTPNGKIDARAVSVLPDVLGPQRSAVTVAPSTPTEEVLLGVWTQTLGSDDISVDDHFFHIGGDSIRVMMMVARLRSDHGLTVGPEMVFANPVLRDLAATIDQGGTSSRLVPFTDGTDGPVTALWPGLGGLPINLKALAQRLSPGSGVYGVQASGINPGEPVHADVHTMAGHDIELLPAAASHRLVGYSFGCRVAVEAAAQLEAWGGRVESLTLICPGNPSLGLETPQDGRRDASFENPEFIGMLVSVFNGQIDHELLREACAMVTSVEQMVDFVEQRIVGFERGQTRRVIDLVTQTYQFDYTFDELKNLRLNCPVLLIKAAGDLYSSVEAIVAENGLTFEEQSLTSEHYTVLKEPGVDELAACIADFQARHAR